MKKRIHLLECNKAHIIAEDVINASGVFVLPEGTAINNFILQRLAQFGIEQVVVRKREMDDDIMEANYRAFEKKYETSIGEMRHLVREIVKGKKIDYPVMSKLTATIVASSEEPDQVIRCLAKVKEVDDYTYYHSINVSFYSMLIASWLNLPQEKIKIAVEAALLHDVGKARISGELLNKKTKLTDVEFDEMKKHPSYGYEMVRDIPDIAQEVKDVILMHHEREDGSGYPNNLTGEHLSIYTKIVSVADVYDAMTSERAYKRALTPFDAFAEFFAACRAIMDLKVINTLLYNLARYYVGCKVELTNGQIAHIVYIPPHCIWKPIVDTGELFLDLSREKDIDIISMA